MAVTQKKKALFAVLAVIVAAALLTGIYLAFRPTGEAGSKTITLTVVLPEEKREHQIETNAAYLGEALKTAGLISGKEGAYGLFVTEVDGVLADDSLQQWWCLTKGGAEVTTGIDSTPIADGEHFELTLTTGY